MPSQKAYALREIDQAVKFNEPIGPDHEFYTDFSKVRGDFSERAVFRALNAYLSDGVYRFDPELNSAEKKLFFLGGMRGSGKTSELSKYALQLHHPQCFFVVTCNIEEALDMNDVEYMDVLIYQLERLTYELTLSEVRINDSILVRMKSWFEQRETEIKTALKGDVTFELGLGTKEPNLLTALLGVFGSLKTSLQGSRERTTTIRTTFKNRFPDFADLFNQYIEEANLALRQNGIGKEILFIIDGLEKTMSAETRRKLIIEESNRLQQIKAYTIFTLPIELMKERQKINQFSTVESFPYVKIVERQGQKIEPAFEVFREFVYKRIDKSLFESESFVTEAIRLGGGSPRELLRLLEAAAFFADETQGKLTMDCLLRAARRLANQAAQYLTQPKLEKLRDIYRDNLAGRTSPFDDLTGEMLEDIIVMEYNDGSYKRVNPVVELSDLYRQYVLDAS